MEQAMTTRATKIPISGPLALGVLLILAVATMFVADLNGQGIQEFVLTHPGSDKAAHFLTHLGLTALIHWILRRYWTSLGCPRSLVIATIGSLALGLLDETQQFFVAGRDFDLFDIAANVCGSATAALLIAGFTISPRRFALLAILPLGIFGGVYAHSYSEMNLFSTGLLQIRAGNLAGAQQSFREAIARGQGNPTLYNELAWLELEFLGGDPAEALHYTTLAVAADSENPDFLDTHAWALHRNGRDNEALLFLLRAKARNNGIYCLHYHLGKVYHALRRNDLAGDHLRRQLAVSAEGDYADRSRALLAAIEGR